MTITSKQLFDHYGDPHRQLGLSVFVMPEKLRTANPALPARIYANNDIHRLLLDALTECLKQGVLQEIREFGGCFNIRKMRGGDSMSTHSWAIAVDWNPSDNVMGYSYAQLKRKRAEPFSDKFLQCWRDTGWECGGDWSYPDRMHFQMAKLLK